MGVLRAQDQEAVLPSLSEAAHLALGAIRQVATDPDRSAWTAWMTGVLEVDLRGAVLLLQAAHRAMIAGQGSGLHVAPPGPASPTRHERRLLRATAAAQVGAECLVDNFLFKLAPDRQVRPTLEHAVSTLARTLAQAGYLFPDFLLPAPALAVARLQGRDVHALRVAWANPHAGGAELGR